MPRVLVVDDQADVCTMISIVLRHPSFRNRRGRDRRSRVEAVRGIKLRPCDRRYLSAGHQRRRTDYNAARARAWPARRRDFRNDRAGLSVRSVWALRRRLRRIWCARSRRRRDRTGNRPVPRD